MVGFLDEEFKRSGKKKDIRGLLFLDDIGNPSFS